MFSERDGGEVGIVRAREMGSTRISAFTKHSELIDAGELGIDDKCSESDHSDWDVIISIIDDYVLSEVIECAWVCLYIRDSSITISIFDVELVYEDSSSKSQNSFFEII